MTGAHAGVAVVEDQAGIPSPPTTQQPGEHARVVGATVPADGAHVETLAREAMDGHELRSARALQQTAGQTLVGSAAYALSLAAGKPVTRDQAARLTAPVVVDGETAKNETATTVMEPGPGLGFAAGTALASVWVHCCRIPLRRS